MIRYLHPSAFTFVRCLSSYNIYGKQISAVNRAKSDSAGQPQELSTVSATLVPDTSGMSWDSQDPYK